MNIRLSEMTRDRLHEFFKHFVYEPQTFKDESCVRPYIYDENQVNAYFDKHQKQGKLHFAIMLDDAVIGDIYLKNIDPLSKSCEIGIHMVSDNFKGKGYGTQAERQVLEYAFNKLNMESVYAHTFAKNHRSRKALIKAGFAPIEINEQTCRFVCYKTQSKEVAISG